MSNPPPLTATYQSPTGGHTFTSTAHSLPSLPREGVVAEKTSYLAALRANASHLQADINAFLTAKMEDDKHAGAGAGAGKADEAKQEDMYGEEDPEEG
jgi:hypothetical protein